MPLPNPRATHPITFADGTPHQGTVMLAQVIDHPNFRVGAYTYASDFNPPQDWATYLAPYLFPNAPEVLHIGRFCQIAHGVKFITAAANHAQTGLSCYPFSVFDPAQMGQYHPDTRDTIIGHDVWIGYGALILPGAQIGHGAIIGAGAVIRGQIPPYAIVAGNPGKTMKYRFDQDVIARLMRLAWWDWPAAQIGLAESAILSGDIETLEHIAKGTIHHP
jgi:virginiamycin A acetyltransferase